MTNLKPVDVAIIGGGWTGLLMAKEITAKTPLSVTVRVQTAFASRSVASTG